MGEKGKSPVSAMTEKCGFFGGGGGTVVSEGTLSLKGVKIDDQGERRRAANSPPQEKKKEHFELL